MADSVSTIIETGAAAGLATGVGTKITELPWSWGAQWISDYYANHRATVIAKAKENCDLFLNSLANKVNALEQESEIAKKPDDDSHGRAEFQRTASKAVLTSSQTGDAQKHEIVAIGTLVSDRISFSEPTSFEEWQRPGSVSASVP